MTAETVEIPPRAGSYTVDDLLRLHPFDRSIELLEGTLIVSPSPRGRHQRVSDAIRRLLHDAAPGGLECARLAASTRSSVGVPFPVELDPADLLGRRAEPPN